MKPVIRQYFYDKLRKALYKHELKTKVWNNPYFPFLTKEEWNIYISNNSNILLSYDISDEAKRINKYIKNKHISTVNEYNQFIKSLEDNGTFVAHFIYKYYQDNIIKNIENKYG